ncbi:50S ribosome-binding GTPase [Nodosilinea sp. LEGE 07298]|uniref:GTPase n=1 Tax=Nodosilinea sp. LEGE 07298 TaxID=2777970 RepID=UPI00187FB0CF|nr:GTPase [Nodosilinea sp. LEGE 07298]MBE9113929.1 50S ribosome-binding GTPase [Nodosilinea sp. LEGE 07298]
MTSTPESLIADVVAFAATCRRKINEFDEAEVLCGLIGASGSGKSSLINAIAGERISAVGVVETTLEAQEFIHQGIKFVDLPGCGTIKFPQEGYIEKLNLSIYDCFLLITANRFTETDVFLFQELSKIGKLCFVIRNKFDAAVEDGMYDNGHSEEQTRKIITADILGNLSPSRPEKIYLVSARKPIEYDLGNLLRDIAEALQGLKQQRFVADMGAYSQEALKKKGKLARDRIPLYAVLAAANGVNPIVGVDIAVDMSLLLKFGNEVAHIYGLTSSQFDYIKRLLGAGAIPVSVAKISQFSAKYLAKEGLVSLLKKTATRQAAKQTTKWIPIIGQLVAAGIGGSATFWICEQIVNEAEQLAHEILSEIIENSKTVNGK